jgi:orotidine-5'-phosphate decarboxylase
MTRQELVGLIRERQSYLCVGLDTEWERIPAHLLTNEDPIFAFNQQIIDATRDLCVAYKPNLAFYEAMGIRGWQALEKTIHYIGDRHFIIADAKRGDIGNTSRQYAKAFFETLPCDAITVAPYMGADSVQPFMGFPGKWVILLALTSNPGSSDFQMNVQADGQALFESVLQKAITWGTPDNLMFVVGATHPQQFAQIRKIIPDHFLLVPGVGAQGGDLATLSQLGLNAEVGLLVNASRGIQYAGSGLDFAEKARAAALEIQQEMAQYLLQGTAISR